MKKKVFIVGILVVLVISLFSISYISAQSKVSAQDLKNYGLCVSQKSKIQNECYKDVNSEYKKCKNDTKISSSDRKLYKELRAKCVKDYKDSRAECKEEYKQAKEDCLVYKNPRCAKNGEKVFIKEEFGSTLCCSKNAGIKPSSFEVDGFCISPTDGSIGTCVNNWWKTCGDGVCNIENEDKCNCFKDCPKEKKCGDFHYSNCPEECVKNCVPSVCSGEYPDIICTDDCDGEGSCATLDITPDKCELLFENIKKEYENVKECKSDLQCVIGTIGLPCTMEQCFSVYNKHSDLKILKGLSKEYNKDCQTICPMALKSMMCLDTSFSEAKCVDNKCEIKPKEINYCESSDENSQEVNACIDLYQPVCGWFNPTINCFRYPCAQTFSNSCYACANSNVLYWIEGECPKG